MAKIEGYGNLQLEVKFTVDEIEARALDALVGYSDDEFLKAFYERLGSHYMKPHEKGLRSLFKSIRDQMPTILNKIDRARKTFHET